MNKEQQAPSAWADPLVEHVFHAKLAGLQVLSKSMTAQDNLEVKVESVQIGKQLQVESEISLRWNL